ncbi:uncharacterized protein LOC110181320 [Drosophila serrata]|uniref:uncharacterized protein LOC110181320 n=1 Tax=Drosophila serrata TaxID=7274 RepID=UPI000A1D1F9F|nr:uncharacterized protein LOC110181320 [Drosophila serrata]
MLDFFRIEQKYRNVLSCSLTYLRDGQCKVFIYTLLCGAFGHHLGYTYNIKQIGVCLQIVSEATSDVAFHVLPYFHDLTECIKYRNHMDLNNLSFLMFGMVVFSWLQSLALEMNCLWTMEDQLRVVLAPHWQRLNQYQCMYLGLPQQCIPK